MKITFELESNSEPSDYLYPRDALEVLHVSVGKGISEAIVGVVHSRECVDVEPHASDVVAEEVVVVAFALRLDHAQVRHGQVVRLLAVHLVEVLSRLSNLESMELFFKYISFP